jgi:hypothetical protein
VSLDRLGAQVELLGDLPVGEAGSGRRGDLRMVMISSRTMDDGLLHVCGGTAVPADGRVAHYGTTDDCLSDTYGGAGSVTVMGAFNALSPACRFPRIDFWTIFRREAGSDQG